MLEESEELRQKLLVKFNILSAAKPSELEEAAPSSADAVKDPTEQALEQHAASVVSDANTTAKQEKKKKTTKPKKAKKAPKETSAADGDDVVKPFEMWSSDEEEANDGAEESDEQ